VHLDPLYNLDLGVCQCLYFYCVWLIKNKNKKAYLQTFLRELFIQNRDAFVQLASRLAPLEQQFLREMFSGNGTK
jgi:hypothetical protein